MGFARQVAGAAIALAGSDKLTGTGGYDRMFEHLGWRRDAINAAASAETLGGVLMIPDRTRRLGGALVVTVSAILLTSELRHRDPKLAVARAFVLCAGLAALRPGRR